MTREHNEDDFEVVQLYETEPRGMPLPYDFCYQPGEDFQVYIEPYALRDIRIHSIHGLDKRKEVAGVLVGQPRVDSDRTVEYVEIVDILSAETGQASGVDVEIPPDEWNRLAQRVEQEPALRRFRIVGWYHSHPTFDAFMSQTDKTTQRTYFAQDWMVAIVVSPSKGQVRCFHGADSQQCNIYLMPTEDDERLISGDDFFLDRGVARAAPVETVVPIPQPQRPGLLKGLPVLAVPLILTFVIGLFAGGLLLDSMTGAGAIGALVGMMTGQGGQVSSETVVAVVPIVGGGVETPSPESTLLPPPTPTGEIATLTPVPTVTPPVPTPLPEPKLATYFVQPGDYLARIAKLHAVSVEAVMEANPQIDWGARSVQRSSPQYGTYTVIILYLGEKLFIPAP